MYNGVRVGFGLAVVVVGGERVGSGRQGSEVEAPRRGVLVERRLPCRKADWTVVGGGCPPGARKGEGPCCCLY